MTKSKSKKRTYNTYGSAWQSHTEFIYIDSVRSKLISKRGQADYSSGRVPIWDTFTPEHTITSHLQILNPHILYCWKPIINVHLCATYTAVVYPWFLAHMQYFCKRSFQALCKECLITSHILNITTCIICH